MIRQLLQSHADNVSARRDFARNLLYASAVHARLASASGASREEANAHRQRATSSYEDGQQLLLEVAEGGKLSSDDERFIRSIRAQLTAIRLP